MSSPDPGSISQALPDALHKAKRALIASRVQESDIFRVWRSIVTQILPGNRRRAEDVEDVLQETLIVLDQELQKPDHPFRNRVDIRKWGARVATNKARQSFRRNTRTEGASAAQKRLGDGDAASPEKVLEAIATEGPCTEPQPDVVAEVHDLQETIEELNRRIGAELNETPPLNRRVIEMWLDLESFERASQDVDRPVWFVRRATFNFKTRPPIESLVHHVRLELTSISAQLPDIPSHVNFGRAIRPLTDFRESP